MLIALFLNVGIRAAQDVVGTVSVRIRRKPAVERR